MIADGPGNYLTPEEHANVALLGQARSRWDNSAFREVECSVRENSLHVRAPGAVMCASV